MVNRGTYLVPTLVAPYFIVENGLEAGIPKHAVDKANYVMDYHKKALKRLIKRELKSPWYRCRNTF